MDRRRGMAWTCAVAALAVGLTLALRLSLPSGSAEVRGTSMRAAIPPAVVVTERSTDTPAGFGGGVTHDASTSDAPSVEATAADTASLIPDDARYESGYALVRVADGVGDEDLAALVAGSATADAVEGWVDDGLAKVRVSPGASVEEALGELGASGLVSYAQPNYQLIPLLGDASDLTAELTEALEPDAAEPLPGTGGDAVSTGAATAEADVADAGAALPAPTGDDDNATDEPTEAHLPEDGLTADEIPPDDGAPASLREALAVAVDDPHAPEQWALASIRAYEAWALARCDGQVTVAVIDVGFDLGHDDLAANVVGAYDAAAGEPGGGTPSAHGTHVAGIVAAVAHNGVGVAGVSHNARVMPLAVASANGSIYVDSVIRAYDYALERADELNLRVVNLSLGGTTKVYDQALIDKIDEAYEAGVVTVAAAGNSDLAPVPYEEYPGDHASVVSVINLRQDGAGVVRASGSNYNVAGQGGGATGEGKNISAPGTAILGTRPGNSYGHSSGTSMAAPHVAGVLALEFAANPGLTASDAVDALYASAADLGDEGWDEEYGHGEVDAAEAVRLAAQVTPGEPDEPVDPDSPDAPDVPDEPVEPVTPDDPVVPDDSGGREPDVPSREDAVPKPADGAPSGAYAPADGPAPNAVEAPGQLQALDLPAARSAAVTALAPGRASGVRLSLVGDLPKGMAGWYRVHVRNRGWLPWARCGADAPTGEKDVQVEVVELMLVCDDALWPAETPAGLLANDAQTRAHLRGRGWQLPASGEGPCTDEVALVLSMGETRRVAQVCVGEGALVSLGSGSSLDAWYRTCDADAGWLGWATADTAAAAGEDVRAVQALLVPAGSPGPESTSSAYLRP